jgi:hypothetical protein
VIAFVVVESRDVAEAAATRVDVDYEVRRSRIAFWRR